MDFITSSNRTEGIKQKGEVPPALCCPMTTPQK